MKKTSIRIISCFLIISIIFSLVACSASALALQDTYNVVESETLKTRWIFENTGSKCFKILNWDSASILTVTLDTYLLKSEGTGLYLTASYSSDGTIRYSTCKRNVSDDGQIWAFYANNNKDGLGKPSKGYTIINFGHYVDDLPVSLVYDSGKIIYRKALWAAGGPNSVHLNENDQLELKNGVTATVRFRWPNVYLGEDYVYTPVVEESEQKEPTVKQHDVFYSSDGTFYTEWKFTPVAVVDYYNVDGSLYGTQGGTVAKNAYAYTIQSKKSGMYLTAVYNSDNSAITLQTGTRCTDDKRQLWGLNLPFTESSYYGLLNLGLMQDCTDGSSNKYAAYILNDLTVKYPKIDGSNGYNFYLNRTAVWGAGKTISSLIDSQQSSDNSFIATLGTPLVYLQEEFISDTTLDTAALDNIGNICYDGKGTTDFVFTPVNYSKHLYSKNGTDYGGYVTYVIESPNSNAFLTANYDGDNVNLKLSERDAENRGQLWVLAEAWPADSKTKYYLLLNLGLMRKCTDSSDNYYPAQINPSPFSLAGEFTQVNEGAGEKTWLLSGNTANINGNYRISDLVSSYKENNGKFSASLMGRSTASKIYELFFDESSSEKLLAVSENDELFESSTVAVNNYYLWKFISIGNYWLIKNSFSDLYLTMNNGLIYTAPYDGANNYQLWKITDISSLYGKNNGIYEIQCYDTQKSINTIDDKLDFSDVSDKSNAGGRGFTFGSDRELKELKNGMICPINSYQWGSNGNYYLSCNKRVWGDINSDSKRNIRDLVCFKKAIANNNALAASFDLDANGISGVGNDIVILIMALLGADINEYLQKVGDENEFTNKIGCIYPENGEEICVSSNQVEELSDDFEIYDSEKYAFSGELCTGKTINLSWDNTDEKPLYYTVYISSDSAFDKGTEYTVDDTSLSIPFLYTATKYYWRISAHYENKTKYSDTFSFNVKFTPRTLSIDGVSNIRDIGGYMTENGVRIKQGLVYRSAYLDEISEIGRKSMLTELMIKTDLDLRRNGEGTAGQYSPLGLSVNYKNISGPYYLGGNGIDYTANWDALANEIRLFADKNNYPVVFHCSVGRDRTGTLAFLLGGLLGMKKEDLFLDYELSFLSVRGCLDKQSVKTMVGQFTNLYNYIEGYNGKDNKPLSSHIESFLKDIGITDTEISAIRSILLENS